MTRLITVNVKFVFLKKCTWTIQRLFLQFSQIPCYWQELRCQSYCHYLLDSFYHVAEIFSVIVYVSFLLLLLNTCWMMQFEESSFLSPTNIFSFASLNHHTHPSNRTNIGSSQFTFQFQCQTFYPSVLYSGKFLHLIFLLLNISLANPLRVGEVAVRFYNFRNFVASLSEKILVFKWSSLTKYSVSKGCLDGSSILCSVWYCFLLFNIFIFYFFTFYLLFTIFYILLIFFSNICGFLVVCSDLQLLA